MSKWVMDSSAILTVLLQEKGHEKIVDRFSEACISTVNVAEIFSKLAERAPLTDTDIRDFEQLGLEVVDFDINQARKAAELRPLTRSLGLSLGDRSCLALAITRGATAITADRSWNELNICPVEVIR
jgi:ribonuclease VapC